jgi:2-methylcitrate dehydratase PrpD
MTGGSIPVTRILASFVEGARYEDVGDGALGRVREHVMDCLGVGIAASAEPPGQIIGELIDSLSQGGSTHLIGTRLSSNTLEAAWANGALFHLLDFDDSGFSHPTACILPAALAIGELCDSDGHELVTAMAAGWEVFERISRSGRASEQLLRQKGVHFTSVYGCPAAAATAGKLLGLNAAQLAVAIGLAASASGGLTEQFGTWGKGPHAGNAARAGVTAALLAQRGYRGSDAVLEG